MNLFFLYVIIWFFDQYFVKNQVSIREIVSFGGKKMCDIRSVFFTLIHTNNDILEYLLL